MKEYFCGSSLDQKLKSTLIIDEAFCRKSKSQLRRHTNIPLYEEPQRFRWGETQMWGLPTSHQHPTYAPRESGGICVKRGRRPEPVRERCWLQCLTPHPCWTRFPQTPQLTLCHRVGLCAAHEQDQRRPWHAHNENTAHFSVCLWCTLSKAFSPPLLPGPKATIVFVVVIDIVFQPYNTKQSDHDSDANVEVERVF